MADEKAPEKKDETKDVNGSGAGEAPTTNNWEAPSDVQAKRVKAENERLVKRLEAQDEFKEEPKDADEGADKVGLPNSQLHEGVTLENDKPLFTFEEVKAPKKGSDVDMSGRFKTADPEKFPAKP